MSITNSHGPHARPGPRPASCGTRPMSSILRADPEDGRLSRRHIRRPPGRPSWAASHSPSGPDLTRRCSPQLPRGCRAERVIPPPVAHLGAGITTPRLMRAADGAECGVMFNRLDVGGAGDATERGRFNTLAPMRIFPKGSPPSRVCAPFFGPRCANVLGFAEGLCRGTSRQVHTPSLGRH
jgi:hypothetical protein